MKRHSFAFTDHVSNKLIFRYKDKYGQFFLAAHPFYVWNSRVKLKFKAWR